MGLNNSCKELSGNIEAVRLYSRLIAQRLGARLVKDGNGSSALRVSEYNIDIMGNSASKKKVTLKVIEDERTGAGCIKIESGSEYVAWQSTISKLCDCCIHNVSRSLVFSVCSRAAEPGDVIRTGQCPCYTFNSKKYNDYLARKNKRQ